MLAPTFNSSFVPLAILSASLLGSSHCAAMCSGLVLAVAPTKTSKFFYHLGRGVGYTLLGALAGFLGMGFFSSSSFTFLSWASVLFLSMSLIALGFKQYLKSNVHIQMPRLFTRAYSFLWAHALRYRESLHGVFILGWLSSFLPCGWLYSFVLGASATRTPSLGAFTLFIFWVGTLPALNLGPLVIEKSLIPFSLRSPRLSGVILILAGFMTIGLRASPLFFDKTINSLEEAPALNCLLHHKQ